MYTSPNVAEKWFLMDAHILWAIYDLDDKGLFLKQLARLTAVSSCLPSFLSLFTLFFLIFFFHLTFFFFHPFFQLLSRFSPLFLSSFFRPLLSSLFLPLPFLSFFPLPPLLFLPLLCLLFFPLPFLVYGNDLTSAACIYSRLWVGMVF